MVHYCSKNISGKVLRKFSALSTDLYSSLAAPLVMPVHCCIIGQILFPGQITYKALKPGCGFIRKFFILYIYILVVITSAKECCRSALAVSHKNHSSNLRENFAVDIAMDKEELIKFSKLSSSRFASRNFMKDQIAR